MRGQMRDTGQAGSLQGSGLHLGVQASTLIC